MIRRTLVGALVLACVTLCVMTSIGEVSGDSGEEPVAGADRARSRTSGSAVEEERTGGQPLLLGVVDFYNPRLMYLKYQPLVDHLSEHTGRPWELAIGADYQETVDALCHGRVAVAYLGPLTYIRARALCGAEPIVRLNTANRSTYESLIMVRADSEIQSLEELRGRRFGFGAALSTSSHLVPRAMLLDSGVGSSEIECHYFEHHERAARAVILDEVDACGVRDIVGERFMQRGLRVLARSRGIPNFPLVMAPASGPELTAAVERALVDAPRQDRWRAQHLLRWDVEFRHGFALAADDDYDPVRDLARRVFGDEALTLSEEQLRCGRTEPW
jgi:phosphonate transport system substrate-binding protein